jgi:cytochrome c oxidase cbb3-type subunit III
MNEPSYHPAPVEPGGRPPAPKDHRDLPSPEKGKPVLRPHVFDGIQEFDQLLPSWWLSTIYLAIAFFFGWWVYKFNFSVPLKWHIDDYQDVEHEVVGIKEIQKKAAEMVAANLTNDVLWEMASKPDVIARGAETYNTICFTCHAQDLSATMGGAKLPGLPLNDATWQYGAMPMQVYQLVSKGSPNLASGMIAWEPNLGAAKVTEVVAYLLSHHKKGPQGEAAGPK